MAPGRPHLCGPGAGQAARAPDTGGPGCAHTAVHVASLSPLPLLRARACVVRKERSVVAPQVCPCESDTLLGKSLRNTGA